MSDASEDRAIDYVLRLGRALHMYGYASPALERALVTTSARLGLVGHFFSTPTSIFVAFGSGSSQRTFLTRVEPGGVRRIALRQHRGDLLDQTALHHLVRPPRDPLVQHRTGHGEHDVPRVDRAPRAGGLLPVGERPAGE